MEKKIVEKPVFSERKTKIVAFKNKRLVKSIWSNPFVFCSIQWIIFLRFSRMGLNHISNVHISNWIFFPYPDFHLHSDCVSRKKLCAPKHFLIRGILSARLCNETVFLIEIYTKTYILYRIHPFENWHWWTLYWF